MAHPRIDVAIVTRDGRNPPPSNEDDDLLMAALRTRGLSTERVAWSDRTFDWSAASVCALRSAYDWPYRWREFFDWATLAARVADVLPPPSVLEWAFHKSYLERFRSAGVPVVPTVYLRKGEHASIDAVLAEHHWPLAIVKPALGLAALRVTRVSADSASQAHVERLLKAHDLLLQPYLESVVDDGELSLIFIAGEISHAVRRIPASGDFRAHFLYSSTDCKVTLGATERALGRAVLTAIGAEALYGRLDFLRDSTGEWLLSEVELVAPMLYLGLDPDAAGRLAQALQLVCSRSRRAPVADPLDKGGAG